jgi:hypothetical protein
MTKRTEGQTEGRTEGRKERKEGTKGTEGKKGGREGGRKEGREGGRKEEGGNWPGTSRRSFRTATRDTPFCGCSSSEPVGPRNV